MLCGSIRVVVPQECGSLKSVSLSLTPPLFFLDAPGRTDCSLPCQEQPPKTHDDDLLEVQTYKQQTSPAYRRSVEPSVKFMLLPVERRVLKTRPDNSTTKPTCGQYLGSQLLTKHCSTIIRALQTLLHTARPTTSSQDDACGTRGSQSRQW